METAGGWIGISSNHRETHHSNECTRSSSPPSARAARAECAIAKPPAPARPLLAQGSIESRKAATAHSLLAQGAIEPNCGSAARPLLAQGSIESRKAATAHSLLAQGSIEPNCGSAARSLLAQGATEYLVIFGIVLIVALAVAAVVGGSAGTSAHVTESESVSYWTSAATPMQVLEATSVYGDPCGISNRGGYELVVRNADPSVLTLNGVSVGGAAEEFCERGVPSGSSVKFDPQAKTVLVLVTSTGEKPCPTGEATSIALVFNYTLNGLAHSQTGLRELYVMCANSLPSNATRL